MSISRHLKWVTGLCELILAIPLLGGLIVIGSNYVALGVMLVAHLLTLVLSKQNREPIYGSVLGVVTSLLGWIPFVGWFLHLISGFLLVVSAFQDRR